MVSQRLTTTILLFKYLHLVGKTNENWETVNASKAVQVLADKKKGFDTNADTTVDYFMADVINANDYYPFGMLMPGRKFSGQSGYRYAFNGKEMDTETYGEGSIYDYGFRIYNPRLGKFLSVDPLSGKYPFYTPYQFAGNKPVWAIDIDGLEPKETSTINAPKNLEGVTVTSSKKKQKALNYVSNNTPVFDYKWGGNITTETFTNQLKERVLDPYSLNQGKGTNFCWAAAAMSYQFARNPEGTASIALDLYSKGAAKVGNLELQVSDAVRNSVGSNTFDKNAGLTSNYVDQLLMMTLAGNLKDYVNFFNASYDLGDQNSTWASGTFNKFDKVMRIFGSNVVTSVGFDAMNNNVLGNSCQTLMDAQAAGQAIFLFVHSAHFKEPLPDAQGCDIGTHFVQVRNVVRSGNSISMDYWDYGQWKTGAQRVSMSIEQLKACTFGILTTKD